MKIVIVQGAFLPVPPLQGGAVEKIWYLMGQEFAKRGHNVAHISKMHKGLPANEIKNDVHYIRIKGYEAPAFMPKYKFLDLVYTIRAIKKIPADADIIVTNTFWAPILLRGKKAKKVYVDVQRTPKGQMKLYSHTGKLRACSPFIYDAILKELPFKSHHMVSYVPNPVPFKVIQSDVKKEKIILFVGRLHTEKGVDVLIEAFSLLSDSIRALWKLIIIGPYEVKDGGSGADYFNKLQLKAQNLNIEFTGPIYEHEKLVKYFAKASIFCYPVQDSSGDAAPVAPREAMAYGAVPVVSSLPCFADFIISEKNGITFDQKAENQAYQLSEKLIFLINNVIILHKLSQESLKVNEQYSPSFIAEKFLNDFDKIVL